MSIGRLGYARSRREEYVGPWLPEPLPDERAPDVAETVAVEASPGRIRRNLGVEVCPSTFGGRPTGPAIRARARFLK